MKRSSTSVHWSVVVGPSSVVAATPFATSATPQTSVITPRRPSVPRQWPISWSERSSVQSGFSAAVSSVKSAAALKSVACAPSCSRV